MLLCTLSNNARYVFDITGLLWKHTQQLEVELNQDGKEYLDIRK